VYIEDGCEAQNRLYCEMCLFNAHPCYTHLKLRFSTLKTLGMKGLPLIRVSLGFTFA